MSKFQPKDMVTNYNRKKKQDAVFLNVKPTLNNITVRKYSNGTLYQLHNGYGKKVIAGRDRGSVATINSTNQQFIPNVFYRNVGPIRWFLCLIGVLPMTRSGPATTRFIVRSLPFVYCVVLFICLSVII